MAQAATPRTKRKAKQVKVTVTLTAGGIPTLQYSHEARDPWKVLNQALCSLIRVAQSDDAYAALEAGRFLVEYAVGEIERRTLKKGGQPSQLVAPGRPMTSEREQIISELRGLYAKALGPMAAAPLVVDVKPE